MAAIQWPAVQTEQQVPVILDPSRGISVVSYPFLNQLQANQVYLYLINNIKFDTVESNIPSPNGTYYVYPRKLAFFSDDLEEARASGYSTPQSWDPLLDSLRTHMQGLVGCSMHIDSCLINHYRLPSDHISAHSDRETSPPGHAVLALTLAPYYARRLIFREKKFAATGPPKYTKQGTLVSANTPQKWTFRPFHGSLYLMMGPGTQKYLTHESPGLTKTELNLTAQCGLAPEQLDRISITWRDLAGAKNINKNSGQ